MRGWAVWVILILVIGNAGWMIFDGAKALIAGDYVTPNAGRYSGQLGPWANVVRAAGIDPRSTLMKMVFVIYGVAFLASAIALVLRQRFASRAVLDLAVTGLWYLPFGTLINILVIVLLVKGGSL